MLVIVQPFSSGARLSQRAADAGYGCLIPTQYPELLSAEVRAAAQVMKWHPGEGLDGLLRCVKQAAATPADSPRLSPHVAELTSFARQVVEAFEVSVGPFRIEARIAADGQPVLIELAVRLPGDHIPELVNAGPGADLYLATIAAACGEQYRVPPAAGDSAGLASITASQPRARSPGPCLALSPMPTRRSSRVFRGRRSRALS